MTTTSATDLCETDARLLDAVQREIPFDPQPFKVIARQLNIDEDDCIARLIALRDERGIIRQISAIFDTHALGYASSLVAARVDPGKLDTAAKIIGQHPGVSHSYQREHDFNLWYTLAVPPDSALGLQGTVDLLHRLSGAAATRLLPTLKLFKIGVKLNVTRHMPADGDAPAFTDDDRKLASSFTLSTKERQMVRILQQHLPIEHRPFDRWAEQARCSAEDLLAAGARFVERRQMRRFSAVLRHREAGFRSNVMACWSVPADHADEVGRLFAGCAAVSHCYLRPTYPDWPYNIFTMIHARDRDEALAQLQRMRTDSGIENFMPLWSIREFKKTRVQYFMPETYQWEYTHRA